MLLQACNSTGASLTIDFADVKEAITPGQVDTIDLHSRLQTAYIRISRNLQLYIVMIIC